MRQPHSLGKSLLILLMRGLSRLNFLLAVISAVVLVAATGAVFAEIMSRLLFGKSLLWVVELSGYALLYMTFLGAPYLLEKNRHVAIDIVTENLHPRWRVPLGCAMSLLGAAVCFYATWYGLAVTLDQYQFGTRETTVLAPHSYLLTWVFPLGMFLVAIQFVAQALACLKR
ncbi:MULTISPECIES: TRAP transporter small permease [Halomonadaceae]|jgi:TRAP-type C4-dicarboxylate transport system permease small subunit|uniref:TRAP transporter small permease protein n=1 Tax=Billgrantia aerodenitrificans TaxID=2733483 RepID=A0ABS9AQ09_9GAMM|nr:MULTISPECIES: TRAP transporter small permease [Halomonas]MCE8023922.1 TRAP transporter small permease [Halomonas aerodenitrificans]